MKGTWLMTYKTHTPAFFMKSQSRSQWQRPQSCCSKQKRTQITSWIDWKTALGVFVFIIPLLSVAVGSGSPVGQSRLIPLCVTATRPTTAPCRGLRFIPRSPCIPLFISHFVSASAHKADIGCGGNFIILAWGSELPEEKKEGKSSTTNKRN